MKRLEIYATKKEVEELLKMHKQASTTPVITFDVTKPDLATRLWDQLKKRVHEMALEHGLPEINGFYGIDLENSQFLEV